VKAEGITWDLLVRLPVGRTGTNAKCSHPLDMAAEQCVSQVRRRCLLIASIWEIDWYQN